jgi:hypothetical protein
MDASTNRNDLARRSLWIVLLTGATIVGSFIFACATPFPALGALAALFIRRRDAFVLTAINWLANQAIGYGFLRYPQNFDSFAWGGVIGLSALAATAAAIGMRSLAGRAGWVARTVACFLTAFVAYELALFAATAFLSDGGGFTAKVVVYVLEVNGFAFAGLLVLQGIGLSTGVAALPRAASAA